IHSSVIEVSRLLQHSRYSRLLQDGSRLAGGNARLEAVLQRRDKEAATRLERLSKLRRELKLALEDAFQLVELGGVLAKSAKIEAAYGQSFASSLAQVSGEFDGIVEEIRASLETLKKSSFFGGR
ncbi:MAG TPA: chemotaxis protein, partial [Azospira sp.]|nr:chemotaxis protein [Azospira sp.]